MSTHTVCLPLAAKYASTDCVEGYSFFHATQQEGTNAQNHSLEAYLDDLCAFVRRTQLIQRHPDHFFDYIRGEEWRTNAAHLDGSTVGAEELAETNRLCTAFRPFFEDSSTVMLSLRQLVRNGPIADSRDPLFNAELNAFYTATQDMMMSRERREANDGVRLTLCPPKAGAGGAQRPLFDRRARAEKKRVLDTVLGYGMSLKKQHEVAIMRESVCDLVDRCNYSARHAPVHTVVNIGEGKGYVSRAIALCDGIQVVGLDCNPAHKERALERVESLIERSISVVGGARGADLVNLLYHPRGHVASVVCRLGPSAPWADLLRGHVPTIRDEHVSDSVPSTAHIIPLEEAQNVGAEAATTTPHPHQRAERVRCRFCGQIMRLVSTAVLLKHMNNHMAANRVGVDAVVDVHLPTREQAEQWHHPLSKRDPVAHLTGIFFETICEPLATGFCEAPGTQPHLPERTAAAAPPTAESLELAHLPRGVRARVCVADSHHQDAEDSDTMHWAFTEKYLTVLGFDQAAGRHRVILDDSCRRESYLLYRHTSGGVLPEEAAALWGADRKALLLEVVPIQPVREYPVMVPSLRNTVMLGLHPCGDLGSNVCRLFTQSQSSGLLLVSCCWHALTESGFPLSNAMRRRGMSTQRISLLLATQPLDMWSTASPEGHRSSSKILFFRSTLALLWKRLKQEWHDQPHRVATCITGSCTFAPQPYLEPAFLRGIAKVKEVITFEQFVEEVMKEYIFAATSKETAYTWHTSVCPACRTPQEAFMVAAFTSGLVREMGESLYAEYFSAFLGLTVLRMWMCHLIETLLLLDRALYLHETFVATSAPGGNSAVSVVPLFDGAVSPRMYGIFACRW